MLKIKLYDGQITKNFNINEFKCHANGEMIINADVIGHIQRLQRFRDWFNRSMSITSGYRTEAYNKQIGGVNDSQHTLGVASDIIYPDDYKSMSMARRSEFQNNIKSKWNELCKADGLQGGVGFYGTFFHMDSRKGSGQLAVWYG